MKEKNITVPMLILGAVGVVTGLVVGKIQERKWKKQLESEQALHQQLQEYVDELETATNQYRTEVDGLGVYVNSVLADLEKLELDEES